MVSSPVGYACVVMAEVDLSAVTSARNTDGCRRSSSDAGEVTTYVGTSRSSLERLAATGVGAEPTDSRTIFLSCFYIGGLSATYKPVTQSVEYSLHYPRGCSWFKSRQAYHRLQIRRQRFLS